jgi:aldehyde:ferredoxin oxidoreductase
MNNQTGGFVGKILRVNLSDSKISEENLDVDTARKFSGGTGYASKILWDEMPGGVDPLGSQNKLILTAGLFTGTGCPGSDSLFSCFKSPLTNCWGEARCGGGMGVELKKAGFDTIIIEGASETPAYLWIHDGHVEICSADHLWGKLTSETQDLIKSEIDDSNARVLCIGPAGEKLVRYANIMVENHRTLGRCDGGAVIE